jgi:Uma2 family endonuclease
MPHCSDMISVFEEPAIRARSYKISVEDYHRMANAEAIAANVELLRGALFEKMSQSPLHASIVEIVRDYLTVRLPSGFALRQEKPLTLEDSEPEPDIALVPGARHDFLDEHPSKAALIVEVSVTSQAIDRLKLEIYAEAGVPECWLILAEERCIERHTEPAGSRYGKVERVSFPATLTSTVFSQIELPPPDLFPT